MGEIWFDFDTTEFKVANGLSIVGSNFTLLYSAWLYYNSPAYLDRVSLKIQTLIALIDIIRHFIYLFNTSLDDTKCKIIAFLYLFCFHVNTFSNVAISVNLQVLYIHEKLSSSWFKNSLYIIPVSASIVLDLVPFMFNAYGRDSLNSCFLLPNNEYYEMLKVLLLYSTNYLGLVYCFVIPVIVLFKLWRTKADPEVSLTPQSPLARKLAFRISLYPLFCFLCHLGIMVFNTSLTFTSETNPYIITWALLGLSINGIMNFTCFTLDPYILESIKKNSTMFFEPIKPEPEAPETSHTLPSIEQNRMRFESEPPSTNNIPDLVDSDASSIASQEIRTPDFRRTPVNSYSQSEPIHFLTDAGTIQENIAEQSRARVQAIIRAPHAVLRFY